MLTDLATAARSSGLKVIEVPDWRTNDSAGGPPGRGVLVHHTGSYDAIGDTGDDLAYAKWLAFTGRPPSVPPPLCNLALSAEGVVYVCCAGNANHAGTARASGPMPAGDGNELYIGIEAMNSGSQGWDSLGVDANGETVTQLHAYARLCAALCRHYGWPADHVRAHKETSTTGKWDPGLLDMDAFRALVNDYMEDDDMPTPEQIAKAVWNHELTTIDKQQVRAGRVLAQTHNRSDVGKQLRAIVAELGDGATKTQVRRARRDIEALAEALEQESESPGDA